MSLPFERPTPARLPPFPRSFRRIVLWIIAALFIVLTVIPWLASFFTDWLWYGEIGFRTVFATSLIWRIARGAGTAFPVLFVNRGDGVTVDVSRMFTRLFFPAAILLSFVTAVSLSAWWLTLLKGMNGVALGTKDPLFNRDISFYLFRLPLISGVLGTVTTLTLLSLVATAAMYWLRNDITLPPRRASAKPRAARHLGGLLALLFVLLAIRSCIVDTSGLLFSTTGPLVGASYTD